MKKTIQILRWIAVPFAAVLGSLVLYAITVFTFGLSGDLYQTYDSGVKTLSLTSVLLFYASQALSGGSFVICGTCTAPSHKFVTSVVLATALVCICFLSAILNIKFHGFQFSQFTGVIASSIGAILACVSVKNEEDEGNISDK